MGKLSNRAAVEIIPVNKLNLNRLLNERRQSALNQAKEPGVNMQRIPYLSDSTIVPRVQKYLESNVDKTYVDINVMADHLRNTYREYSKRKRSAFRASVKKAYSIVLRSYGLEDNASTDEEEVTEESDQEDEQNARYRNICDNPLNNQLMDIYNKRPMAHNRPLLENELIDISSDESDGSHPRSNNGPSTSQRDGHPPELAPFLPPGLVPMDRGKKRKMDNLLMQHKIKKKRASKISEEPSITFKDIGGMTRELTEICKLLLHISHPELFREIGITPPRGFLLHGPPGCGKTLLANAIAGELSVPLIKVAAPELVAGVSGESEERIRELFERALGIAPCVLFIDEIDAITPNRQNAQKEMERRIVAQLLSCLDDLNQTDVGSNVVVIGATNRPDAIDPAMRRAGRFDREICLGIPNVEARLDILKVLSRGLRLADDFDFESLAKYTPGFVGADLRSLIREAAMVAVNRKFNQLKESRKLKAAIDAQKALEAEKEKAAKKAAELAEAEKNKEKETVSVADSSAEPDIIVDDETSKDAAPAANNGEIESSDAPVVVIDDEVAATTKPSQVVANGEVKNDAPVVLLDESLEQMPVDLRKDMTPLEELLDWLHDKKPISQAQLQDIFITMEDFGAALKCVQPSAKREGFATVPDTTWNDVGSLRDIREELQMAILAPVRHAEQFKALGINVPTGVFLCGPPGCGKTLLAKAIANEAGINFISVKGPELLNMYVGESERAVRVCFERARNSAPCVIFFDELDALCPKRSDSRENGATMRVVNQMLTEMDGVEGRQGVFLLAASNRPDIVDPAVLRPGRLDKIIYVGLPTKTDRVDILRAITKNGTVPRLASDVDLETIGSSEQCAGYTGADLAALVREAGVVALKDFMMCGDPQQSVLVTTEHFNRAVAKIRPSVPEKDQKHYEKLRKQYTAMPQESDVEEMEYS